MLTLALTGCTSVELRDKPVPAPAPPVPNVYREAVVQPPSTSYFVVTAVSNGLESLPSNEVFTTNNPVVLAWEYPSNQMSQIDGFQLYRGTSSGTYRWTAFVGTNLTTTWPIPPKVITHFILSWSESQATIYSASELSGPWLSIGTVTGTNLVVTNNTHQQFYRADVYLRIEPQ